MKAATARIPQKQQVAAVQAAMARAPKRNSAVRDGGRAISCNSDARDVAEGDSSPAIPMTELKTTREKASADPPTVRMARSENPMKKRMGRAAKAKKRPSSDCS